MDKADCETLFRLVAGQDEGKRTRIRHTWNGGWGESTGHANTSIPHPSEAVNL